jgi:hypothetical protein
MLSRRVRIPVGWIEAIHMASGFALRVIGYGKTRGEAFAQAHAWPRPTLA